MAHSLLPKMAWNWFSPSMRVAGRAALLLAVEVGASGSTSSAAAAPGCRRCVAMLRICGVAACAHASASAGQRPRTSVRLGELRRASPAAERPARPACRAADAVEPGDAAQVDEALRRVEPLLQAIDEIDAAGLDDRRRAPSCAIASSRLVACTHSKDFIGAPPCCRACRARRARRAGVIGSSRTRTPMAL